MPAWTREVRFGRWGRWRGAGRAGAGARGASGAEGDEPEVNAPQVEGAEDYRALLDAQEARIRELEGQVAEAAKSKESADALAAEIERLRAEAADERLGYELRLAGARNLTAAKALLAERGGDVAELKGAEPWLFADAAPAAGTTGLEPAGTAAKTETQTMERWRGIASLDDEE